MNRRDFLKLSAGAAAATILPACAGSPWSPKRPQPKIPRWRGFNLTEMTGMRAQPYVESDFQWMSEWGFDFARLPLSYWTWSSAADWMTIDTKSLEPLDQAIEFGDRHGVHLCMAFHRIPGYCVNGREHEPHQLFGSTGDEYKKALQAATFHWRTFARRYKNVPNSRLSFDLLNEPPASTDVPRYTDICKTLIDAIRQESPDRLIFANGADLGQTPVLGLIDEGIVQSSHDYQPKMVSHYQAKWVPASEFESLAPPTWPMVDKNGVLWDRAKLRIEDIDKWKPLTDVGAPVHVGEWGTYVNAPHGVCLAFMADELALWKQAGWGWSMWNLRGGFGVVDSGRADVDYEDFRGHKLDRKMLELIRSG
ncbi:MAG TPA: cellulase family glycosylhydrolase [Opitutaceae bacterium]|jgi:endoglucanase|nr:cellulase family glycosylhydrolase [Opitutaceae bacterium]